MMTVRPDFGPEYGEDQWRSELPVEQDAEEEREVEEREREDLQTEFLDPEENEAHAPGQVCERCGQVITAVQDARRRPDGQWVHDECPVLLTGGPAAAAPGTPS
jgi:hypothetical protein